MPVSPHDGAGPVNLVAGGHTMLTVPNDSGGRLRLAPRPGLGIEPNLDYLRANTTTEFDA